MGHLEGGGWEADVKSQVVSFVPLREVGCGLH